MTIEEIYAEWGKDAPIDPTDIAAESINIPRLRVKYLRWHTNEKLAFIKLETEYKQLKFEKYEFYTQGPTKETQEKGWTLPPIGRPLTKDLPLYLDADRDLIDKSLRLAAQREKVDILTDVLHSLKDRGYWIKNHIEKLKFDAGA